MGTVLSRPWVPPDDDDVLLQGPLMEADHDDDVLLQGPIMEA